MDEGDKDLALVHHVHLVLVQGLVHQGLLDLEDHLRAVVDLLRIVDDLRAGLDIILVVIEGAVAGVALYEHLKTILDKLSHRFGGGGYTSFVVHDFLGNTNDHSYKR